VKGVERRWDEVQRHPDERPRAARRHAGQHSHHVQGTDSQREHHRALLAHGHLAESGGRPRH